MKLDTHTVKGKKFTGSISSRLSSTSVEYRALAILRYLYPGKYEEMIKRESPDLQDYTNDVGIEVVFAVDKNEMYSNRLFSEFVHGEKDINQIKEKIGNGQSIVKIAEGKYSLSSGGTYSTERRIFQECIKKKIEKLPIYKEKFNTVGLSILSDCLTTLAQENVQNWISEIYENSETFYDFIYVIFPSGCSYYNLKENSYTERTIPEDDYIRLSIIARMTAEGELSLNDEEWSL